MPAEYAPLSNAQDEDEEVNQFQVGDDDSDDEHDESRPLNPAGRTVVASHPLTGPNDEDEEDDDEHVPLQRAPIPGAIGGLDYDLPPPGSPPDPTHAIPGNGIGNSNGVLPSSPVVETFRRPRRGTWFRRTAAAILPAHYVQRMGFSNAVPLGPVGGGTQNDGVFANVAAKPTRPVRVQDGDDTYLVPEDAQTNTPPSYSSAQADAVPTYGETFSQVTGTPADAGDVVVEGLPTGTLFSFMWNMLVSVSFQFIGFLLTYLLHTTHAGRYGSRAGLGVTLIQYGIALRKAESWVGGSGMAQDVADAFSPPTPTFATAKEAEEYYSQLNATMPDDGSGDGAEALWGYGLSSTATEWVAFVLMCIGWFILLSSLLGYWRVKRWERSILSSSPAAVQAAQGVPTTRTGVQRFLDVPGLTATRGASLLRQGLGLAQPTSEDLYVASSAGAAAGPSRANPYLAGRSDELPRRSRPGQTQYVIRNTENPSQARREARNYVAEERLHRDLIAAGLL